jgi:FixJ family two-component response regulator
MMMPTVFLVDDDAAVRDALSLLLSLKGLRAQVFASAERFLETYDPAQRGCLLTDLRMPGMSGLELNQELQRRGVTLPVVLLTAHGDVATARAALKTGAFDFLEKPVNDELLMDVLTHAVERDAQMHRAAQQRSATIEKTSRLTQREREVLMLLSRGLQNREIAAELQISPRTVEVYKARMMEKLDCRSLADAVRIGLSLDMAEAAAGEAAVAAGARADTAG